ncbi:unnamed protein product [Malus baccata var. baccata]
MDCGSKVWNKSCTSACKVVPSRCGGICGAKNNHKATRGFLGEDDKFTLEAYRVSYTRAVENHLSTKSGVPKIVLTLAKILQSSQTFFSQNSNFGIGGSSAKAPPIHRGRVRLLALT